MLYSISYPLVILFLYLYIFFFRTGLICMRQAFFPKLFNSLFTKFLFLLLTLSLKRWRYKVSFSLIGFIIWLLSMRQVGLPTFVLTYQRWGAWRQPTTSKCPSRLNSYLSSVSSLDIGVCYFIYASLITITHLRFDTPTMGCMEAANYEQVSFSAKLLTR